MNEKGNKYAIAALKDRRATLAGEIVRLNQDIMAREEQLSHLDATLHILDPEYRASTVHPKRIRRVKLFGGGELSRLVIDALRRADGKPLSISEIADAIIAAKGRGQEIKRALILRVRANLGYLRKMRGAVEKIGDHATARWRLNDAN
jgi:hypothetical protein